ncbi:hypothetical protein RHGRI_000160 [Rhododendron griersonianum]|uniref:PGG domain-containing protein n=1 Tax=Rhododendron griersonianum TaxID=479676 RepID=A0AAV6LGD5_9ERIC|nr:hypothetical protein RHGRI_000160 [Rhododendron griersonianum]
MEELLCNAAMRGDLESLNEIIAKDNYILDNILVGSFKGKNPLHVAISTGQAEFVLKLLEIKPKLAEVVDTELGAALHIASANGDLKIVEALVEEIKPKLAEVVDTKLGTALHIASANGDIKIVEALVELSPEMCMARDRDGNNPLHIAAVKGKVDVLKKLIQTCPCAAQVIVDRGDTILHLCVNYNQLESLKLLLEMIRDHEFAHSKDANGNTILHVAVFGKRAEIVKHVLYSTEINVNAFNEAGWTAMDINFFVQSRHEEEVDPCIQNLLGAAGAKRRTHMLVLTPSPRAKKLMPTLMVVSSLLATMAFQVGVNPPGGVWQEGCFWQDDSKEHIAGKAILAYKYPKSYSCFIYFNTVGFLLSLTLILSLHVLSAPNRKRPGGWVLLVMSLLTIMTTAFAYIFHHCCLIEAYDGNQCHFGFCDRVGLCGVSFGRSALGYPRASEFETKGQEKDFQIS